MTHTALLRVILASLVLCAASRTAVAAQTRYEFSEVHMGMPVRIVMYAPNDSTARHAARAAFARIAYLDDMMSDYRPDSELNRLNASAGSGTWFKVSPELFEVLSLALEIAEASDGAFDPTVGPFVALWREARKTGRLPAKASLDSARELVGWSMVSLDDARRAIRLRRSGMHLDLGGIAKGYIVQAASESMRKIGASATLVGAGGDFVLGDSPPGHAGWTIRAEGATDGIALGADTLSNRAISSSGSTFQFVEIYGMRYSHVIDPRSGLGSNMPAITHVIARHGGISDGVATALSAVPAGGVQALNAKLARVFAAESLAIVRR